MNLYEEIGNDSLLMDNIFIRKFNTIMQKNIKDYSALSGIFNKDEPRVNWHDENIMVCQEKA